MRFAMAAGGYEITKEASVKKEGKTLGFRGILDSQSGVWFDH
jgi:hypothetical protein